MDHNRSTQMAQYRFIGFHSQLTNRLDDINLHLLNDDRNSGQLYEILNLD